MKKRKRIGSLSLFVILIASVLTGCVTYTPTTGTAGYEEGTEPWIIFNDTDCSEATICWLSAARTDTKLLFGETGGDLILIEPDSAPAKLHRVTIEDIEPGTSYSYAPLFPGTDEDEASLYDFDAPPGEDEAYRLIIVGDMQPKNDFTARGGKIVAAGIRREDPDLVIQLGDLAYLGGLFRYWEMLLDDISDFSPYVPFQAIPGNHDQYVDGGKNYARIFPYDFIEPKDLYFSFDYGNAHFVMMNAFDDRGKGVTDAQKAWAGEDITLARENGAEWIFLIIHDTVLSSGTMGSHESLLSWLVPFSDAMDVDAVFFGHDHHYEHWLVEYGKDGLLFDPDHVPAGNTVHFWCAGGGGGSLEIDYGLLERSYKPYDRTMYRADTGEAVALEIQRYPWDAEVYIDHTGNPEYGQLKDGKHYYQLPETPYRSDAAQFGYQYGEETLHYIILEVDGSEARVSVHYPNGDLLTGPEGIYPQEFILTKD